MKIHESLAKTKSCISFEFFPPKTEEAENKLFEVIARLERLRPGYVSVNYRAGGGTCSCCGGTRENSDAVNPDEASQDLT